MGQHETKWQPRAATGNKMADRKSVNDIRDAQTTSINILIEHIKIHVSSILN
jgi:hypothetical protein